MQRDFAATRTLAAFELILIKSYLLDTDLSKDILKQGSKTFN